MWSIHVVNLDSEGSKKIDPICYSLPVHVSFKDTDGGTLRNSSFLYLTDLITSREDFVRRNLVISSYFFLRKRRTDVRHLRVHC